jgi:TRAP-type C4-dicarboxylate transport system substrate-binding protein
MTNEEMLAAIKEMFAAERTATDKKIESTQAATDVQFEAANKKIETTQKETIDILHEEMQNIAEVAADKAIQRVQTLMENREDKQIQLLIEGQQEILRRLPVAEEQGEIKARVATLEHVTAEHTREIHELQRQA